MGKKSLIIFLLFLISFTMNLGGLAEAKRIVSLSPSITEILFSLDLGKQVVGVTANCDYPEEVKKIEKTGLFGSPNLEKIISLKPDLVLAPDLGVEPTISKLRDLDIATIVLPSHNIKDVLESIENAGMITGKGEAAKILLHKIQNRIKAIKKGVAGQSKLKVLVIIWVTPNTIITAGRKSFINELIGLAGGENLAADLDFHYPMISPEFILAKNPDLIIFGDSLNSKKTIEDLLAQPGIKKTKAVISGRTYRNINPDLFLRPGPRLIDGLEKIAKILHPNVFTTGGDDLDEKT